MTSCRQVCERVLELDKEASPSKWVTFFHEHQVIQNITEDIAVLGTGRNFKQDAELIVSYRNEAPKLAEALLIALEAIELEIKHAIEDRQDAIADHLKAELAAIDKIFGKAE
jgi:hypothetical protein